MIARIPDRRDKIIHKFTKYPPRLLNIFNEIVKLRMNCLSLKWLTDKGRLSAIKKRGRRANSDLPRFILKRVTYLIRILITVLLCFTR